MCSGMVKSMSIAHKMMSFIFTPRCSYILDASGEPRSFRPRDRDEMVKQVRLVHNFACNYSFFNKKGHE